jgi:hypothetical protein
VRQISLPPLFSSEFAAGSGDVRRALRLDDRFALAWAEYAQAQMVLGLYFEDQGDALRDDELTNLLPPTQ